MLAWIWCLTSFRTMLKCWRLLLACAGRYTEIIWNDIWNIRLECGISRSSCTCTIRLCDVIGHYRYSVSCSSRYIITKLQDKILLLFKISSNKLDDFVYSSHKEDLIGRCQNRNDISLWLSTIVKNKVIDHSEIEKQAAKTNKIAGYFEVEQKTTEKCRLAGYIKIK